MPCWLAAVWWPFNSICSDSEKEMFQPAGALSEGSYKSAVMKKYLLYLRSLTLNTHWPKYIYFEESSVQHISS